MKRTSETSVPNAARGRSAFLRTLTVGLPLRPAFILGLPTAVHSARGPSCKQHVTLAVTNAPIDCVMMDLYALSGCHAMSRFTARVMQ